MEQEVSGLGRIVVLFVIILLFSIFFLSMVGGGKEQITNAGADISPTCGGWQAVYLCQKACSVDNACDTTHCNPKNPADTESDTCKVFLEKINSHAIAEVSPKEVSLKDGTATITVTVTDKDKNPIKATVTASGAGNGGPAEIQGTGSITVDLIRVGAIRIKATPAETKLSAASALVNVVK